MPKARSARHTEGPGPGGGGPGGEPPRDGGGECGRCRGGGTPAFTRLAPPIPVYEWLMWQMGGFGPMPGQVHHFIALENEQDRAYGLQRFMAETRRLYGVLDRRLAKLEFVAGELSVADFAILGWAWRHPRHKVELSDFPHVKRWYEALMARPGVKRGMEAKLD